MQLQSRSSVDRRLKKELTVASPIRRGQSKGARLVQELLRVHRINVVIDGDLGPATAAGLANFCKRQGIAVQDAVDQALMDALAQPLLRVAAPIDPAATLTDTVAALARAHLREHPLEIGGANRGPWVRLYMNGCEGDDYPWCAGFVTYLVDQAARAHGVPSPIGRTFSCDRIGTGAMAAPGKLRTRVSPTQVPTGSIFLVPHGANKHDWVHTGIIVEPDTPGPGEVFRTIEGNTNDQGSREGFEVCERYRACSKVDVVLL